MNVVDESSQKPEEEVKEEKPNSEAKAKTLTPEETEKIERIRVGVINLLPVLTEKEEQIVETKDNTNIRMVVFILVIILISFGFLGYNMYVKNILELEKQKLEILEEQFELDLDLVQNNNAVLDRYALYRYIVERFFSSKEVLVFWQDVSQDLAEITSIELSSGLDYEIKGEARNLLDVAKFWHFLSVDSRVSEVHLENLSLPVSDADGRGTSKATFTFEGKLDIRYFDKEVDYD